MRFWCGSLVCFFVLVQPAGAMILFGLDNSANQSDPGTGVPFESVGLLSNAEIAAISGSTVHLGDGYMLTANHVGMASYVIFDGTTFYERDLSYIPTQVAPGVDMKIFKLNSTPTVGAASLYTGTAETGNAATQVGWGFGRVPTIPVNSLSVSWGDSSTVAKRWGLNTPLEAGGISYPGYSYGALITYAGSGEGSPPGLGPNEAASADKDSGSALFQEFSGIWYLVGLTTVVETADSSTFGNDAVDSSESPDPLRGDANGFVRISTYQSAILASIPEPTTAMCLLGSTILLLRRRRIGIKEISTRAHLPFYH